MVWLGGVAFFFVVLRCPLLCLCGLFFGCFFFVRQTTKQPRRFFASASAGVFEEEQCSLHASFFSWFLWFVFVCVVFFPDFVLSSCNPCHCLTTNSQKNLACSSNTTFPTLAHTNNHHLPSPSSVGILLLARKLSPFFLSASFFFFPCISRVALPCIPHSPFRQSLNPLQASNLTATVQSNKQKGLFWFCFFVFCFLLWWSWRSAQTLPLPFSPRRSLS